MGIMKCLVKSEDGFHIYQGYYVNGGVIFNVTNNRGIIKRHNARYNPARHELVADAGFDAKMQLWRDFFHILHKRKISRFAKSVVWKECFEIRVLFKTRETYLEHIKQMRDFNVLTVDGKYLIPGEKP